MYDLWCPRTRIIYNSALPQLRAHQWLRTVARLHYQVHLWFTDGTAAGDFETLNARVYTELFATPKSDPWLGLVDDTTYDGLSETSAVVRG